MMRFFSVRRTCQLLCFCLAAVFSMQILGGCASQNQESDGSGYLFTISLPANPQSLDPQSATDSASKTILRNLYEGLVEQNSDGSITLAAAESYTVSEDRLVYTFTLHDDRYWYYDENQNDTIDEGESWRVTAQDYVYAFQRIFDAQTQSPYVETFSAIQNGIEANQGTAALSDIGVMAVSDTVLQFTLAYPDARFLNHLASTAAYPCNEAFFLGTKGKYGLDQTAVASCGAFYLRLWFYDPYGSDNLIYMRRNAANRTARSVYPTNLTFQIRRDAQEVMDDFQEGTADLVTTSLYQPQYMERDGYTVTAQYATTLGLIFNPDNTDFANQNIREALSLGIDRSNIGGDSNGDLLPAYGIIPPALHWNGATYREQMPETVTEFSQEAALAAFQRGMQELQKESLDTTKILVCAPLMDCENLHDILQTWQRIFGFYIGIEEVSESDYWQRLAEKKYTIAVYGLTPAQDDPVSALMAFQSEENDFYYNSSTVDSLLTDLRTAGTSSELLQKCSQLEQTILDEMQFIPIFYKNQYLLTKSGNADIEYDPFTDSLNLRDAKHFE